LYLTKNYTVKMSVGEDVYIKIFLTSALVGDEWSASCLSFYCWPKSPESHWTGGWVGPIAGMDDMDKSLLGLKTASVGPGSILGDTRFSEK
jgi:hypothetical protein